MIAATSLTDFASVGEVDVEGGTLPVVIAGDGRPHFLAETAPLGESATMTGAGHIVNIAQPAAFNE